MKTETNFLQPVGKTVMQHLIARATVKETVATTAELANHKTVFCAADLWNIQRMRKTRLLRRQWA